MQIIFTDVLVDESDAQAYDELLEELDLLRSDLQRILWSEEEIWITVSPISIVRANEI